ncbi:MAG TPA: sulfatase-like hydrolase/transferase [Polyangia bacterium]|jgi:arylsulfatase A-like enzyme/fluoride ion exporter CrcB/FEX
MIGRLRFSRLGPIAASVLAGFLGAGVVDVIATVLRAPTPGAAPSLLLLSLGLYGAAGLLAASVVGLLAAGVLAAIPGGPAALVDDPRVDGNAAAGLLSALAGTAVIAVVVALGQRVLVRPMQSDRLATIASAGLVLIGAIPAGAVAVALFRPLRRWVVPRLPRPAKVGTTGGLLLAGGLMGALATVSAFSRADWRVLDLSPFVAFAVVIVAGVGHGLFWYRSASGRRLAARIPSVWVSHALVAAIFIAFVGASRLGEKSPAFAAAEQGSLGLRFGLRVARAATDGDGDGFSARFGGGDCDDHRADVYPGAEDIPGNGIDENCEGGDAVATADDDKEADSSEAASDELGDVAPPTKEKENDKTKTSPAGDKGAATNATGAFKGNILIITIDALRADRLGVAGYGRPAGKSLTPNLDALARRGAYFRRVWSQAPNTPRSFPAILTSQQPSGVKWDKPKVNYPNLLPSNHTFFEDLRAAGLTPTGVFSHFYFTDDRGISKGFKDWSNDGAGTIAESNKDSASPRIVPRVIAHLKKAAASHERFVMWTHLFEPHSSYMTHKEFPTSGATGVPGLMEKYDYEIAFVDMWVGKLLKALDALGLAKDTAVVVMADHGEAWSEHKAMFHGTDLFDEQLRIPLIIAVPGRAPVVNTDAVAAVDLAPTLVDLVGAPIPRSFRGRSLLPALAGEKLPPRPIFSEMLPATAWPHHAVMLVDGDKKLIHRVSEPRFELYDLTADPGEKQNLADDAASKATFDRMRHTLLSFEERKR